MFVRIMTNDVFQVGINISVKDLLGKICHNYGKYSNSFLRFLAKQIHLPLPVTLNNRLELRIPVVFVLHQVYEDLQNAIVRIQQERSTLLRLRQEEIRAREEAMKQQASRDEL